MLKPLLEEEMVDDSIAMFISIKTTDIVAKIIPLDFPDTV